MSHPMKRWMGGIAICLLLHVSAEAREVSVRVLGLFHSYSVLITPSPGHVLECAENGRRWTIALPYLVRVGSSTPALLLSGRTGDGAPHAVSRMHCDDGQSGATEFTVAVPGKITRHYRGKLRLERLGRELLVIVEMELETAVASGQRRQQAP